MQQDALHAERSAARGTLSRQVGGEVYGTERRASKVGTLGGVLHCRGRLGSSACWLGSGWCAFVFGASGWGHSLGVPQQVMFNRSSKLTISRRHRNLNPHAESAPDDHATYRSALCPIRFTRCTVLLPISVRPAPDDPTLLLSALNLHSRRSTSRRQPVRPFDSAPHRSSN